MDDERDHPMIWYPTSIHEMVSYHVINHLVPDPSTRAISWMMRYSIMKHETAMGRHWNQWRNLVVWYLEVHPTFHKGIPFKIQKNTGTWKNKQLNQLPSLKLTASLHLKMVETPSSESPNFKGVYFQGRTNVSFREGSWLRSTKKKRESKNSRRFRDSLKLAAKTPWKIAWNGKTTTSSKGKKVSLSGASC